MAMQVPTVTLEDLQAFQAAHFPGPHKALHPPATEPVQDEPYADEDDLGYYPDGVKRTLTDEQIRIFRHSEIHALLRKRQLEQDEAEYEARARQGSVEGGVSADEDARRDKLARDENRAKDTAPGQGQDPPRLSGGAKSRARGNHETRNDPSQTLDYEGVEQSPARRPRPMDPRAAFPGRKIISYED